MVEENVCKERKKRVDEALQRHEARLTALEKTYSIMAKMDYRMGNLESNINEIKEEVKKIEEKPSQRYDDVVKQVIAFFIEAILVIVAVKIGLK